MRPTDRSETHSPASRARAAGAERGESIATDLAAAARLEQSGDMPAARAAYERVVRAEPAHVAANYQLAVIADNERRFSDAEKHYRVLLAKSPRNPDLLASLGWSYLLQERFDESERALRDALSIDPQHRTALYNLGYLYGNLGDFDQALAIFRTAGNEQEAQRAISELFPRGRPADGSGAPIGAPRNPFKSVTDELAIRGSPGLTSADDPLAANRVSAPVAWPRGTAAVPATTGAGRPSVAAASPTAPAVTPRSGDQPDRIHDAGHFDELFAELDVRQKPGNPKEVIAAGDFDETTTEQRAPAVPVITPKARPREQPRGSRSGGTADQAQPARPDDGVAAGARPSGERSLPEWPHHPTAPGQANLKSDTTVSPEARAAAARLGLNAGPGGLLFPTTLTKPGPPAAGKAD